MSCFLDRELEHKLAGGVIRAGRLTLRLPRVFGFCGGVSNALRLVEQTLAAAPAGAVWLLGDIIHNESVNDRLRARGVRILGEAAVRAAAWPEFAAGDTVIVPAFGLPLAQMRRLEALAAALPLRLVDTTCGYVQRIWRFVAAQAAAGATVFVLGKPRHPETLATLSRAQGPANAVVLLPDAAAVGCAAAAVAARHVPALPPGLVQAPERYHPDLVALAVQTTLLEEEVARADAALRAAAAQAGAAFASAATVCGATRERQAAARELCRSGCDLFLVLGGFTSSNTTQLYRLARQHGPAFFLRTAADLRPDGIRHFLPDSGATVLTPAWLPAAGPVTIGLLAGASCPPADVAGVIRALEALGVAG